jgi:hypothetical protein
LPLGFFLSTASPRSEKPNGLVYLVPLGGVLLRFSQATRREGPMSEESIRTGGILLITVPTIALGGSPSPANAYSDPRKLPAKCFA